MPYGSNFVILFTQKLSLITIKIQFIGLNNSKCSIISYLKGNILLVVGIL